MNNTNKIVKAPHYISSPFGYRLDPFTGITSGHNGIDIGVCSKEGIPCYAVADGVVKKISKDTYGGSFCYIEHKHLKRVSLYYHNRYWSVSVNQAVKEGQQIGVIGGKRGAPGSGLSTGIHQHFSWILLNSNSYKYYKADYEDFTRYIFPKKKEEEMKIIDIIMTIFGKRVSEKGYRVDGSNYISPRVLSQVDCHIGYSGPEPIITMNGLKLNVNGETKAMAGFCPNGNSFVDLTDICEELGYKAVWDNSTRVINIVKK